MRMYRLYLLCVMSAVAFENSDEGKYIDLLPEEEKQEFLNRVARRIIDEIQSKDSPEQSHVAVSDDQLNVHNAYVQDLIKEESESMRKEKRDNIKKEIQDTEGNNSKLEKYNAVEKQSNSVIDENMQHIDLTLRNDGNNDVSMLNIIPVKVVYDDDDTKSTKSPVTTLGVQDDLHSSNFIQKEKTRLNNSQFNNSENHIENASTISEIFFQEKEDVNKTNINIDHDKSLISEDQFEITSNNDVLNLSSNGENVNKDLKEIFTESPLSLDVTTELISGKVNKNYDDILENTESSMNINISSNNNKESKDYLAPGSDTQSNYNNTKVMPLSTEIYSQSSSKTIEYDNTSSSLVYVTTVKSLEDNANKKSEIKDRINTTISSDKSSKNTTIKSIKINEDKKHLRKKLQILLEDLPSEKEELPKITLKPKSNKKNVKPYLVYEVSEEKPIFVQVEDSVHNEQHHVVPIYNFAPENAYYNAYNHYGVNNDQEEKELKQKYLLKNEEALDKELYLRSGFVIDLDTNNHYHLNDKKKKYNYQIENPPYSHREHNNMLNSNIEFNSNFFQNFMREKKSNKDVKQISRNGYKKRILPKPPKISIKIKYMPLRGQVDNDYDDAEASRRRPHRISSKIKYIPLRQQIDNNYGEDKPIPQKHKNLRHYKSTTEDQMNAIKTLLYQKRKFKYLHPSSAKFKSGYKRMFDEGYNVEVINDKRQENDSIEASIDLDYYFGRNKINSNYDEPNFNDGYLETEDVRSSQHNVFGVRNNNINNINVKKFKMEEDNNCEHGCIEMDLISLEEHFDNYLKNLLGVLKDMIYTDKTYLVNYDWLLSTVNLESALKKLQDLIYTVDRKDYINPLDSKLLNYIVYLYNMSIKNQSQRDVNYIVNSFINMLRRRVKLPKNKHKRPGDRYRKPMRFWYSYYGRYGLNDDHTMIRNANLVRSFKHFLNDLEENLFDLHYALKQIASITTYSNQDWYKDLKNIYLKSATKKQLMQVILHLAASRLFDSIEETAQNAEENKVYIKSNGVVLRRIRDEFELVLRILEQIKKTNQ